MSTASMKLRPPVAAENEAPPIAVLPVFAAPSSNYASPTTASAATNAAIDIESQQKYNNDKNKNPISFIYHILRNNKREVLLCAIVLFFVFMGLLLIKERKVNKRESRKSLDDIINKVTKGKTPAEGEDADATEHTTTDEPPVIERKQTKPAQRKAPQPKPKTPPPPKKKHVVAPVEQEPEEIREERRRNEKYTTVDDEDEKTTQQVKEEPETKVQEPEPERHEQKIEQHHYVQPETNERMSNEDQTRAEKVKQAFIHAFKGYEAYSWGKDEFKPISKTSHNWVGYGVGLTIIDSLDTMIIMGLNDLVHKSLEYIRTSLSFDQDSSVSVFEITIRALGGLLSAHELLEGKEPVLLEKAIDLGNRLLPAFETPTGIPYAQINLRNPQHRSNPGWTGGGSVLSEFTTIQLEFRKLSALSGDPRYDQAVTKVMDTLERHSNHLVQKYGLYPAFYNPSTNQFTTDHITLGAWGDSFYEYELKQYLMTNQTETRYQNMYLKSMNGVHEKLFQKSKPNGLYYIAEGRGSDVQMKDSKMDHLVCFAGGMLALGAYLKADNSKNREEPTKFDHFEYGKQLTHTCYEMYKRQPTGISSETVNFNNPSNDFSVGVPTYLLRPETVESIFYLYRITGDKMYQDWNWNIFQSIERYCKIPSGGYSGIRNVGNTNNVLDGSYYDDHMQSFFLAETLKYLYLSFTPKSVVDLRKWVFNTEAHPLRIYNTK